MRKEYPKITAVQRGLVEGEAPEDKRNRLHYKSVSEKGPKLVRHKVFSSA